MHSHCSLSRERRIIPALPSIHVFPFHLFLAVSGLLAKVERDILVLDHVSARQLVSFEMPLVAHWI